MEKKIEINKNNVKLGLPLAKAITLIYGQNAVGKTTISRYIGEKYKSSSLVFNSDLFDKFNFKDNSIASPLSFDIKDDYTNLKITEITKQINDEENNLKEKYTQLKAYTKNITSLAAEFDEIYKNIDLDIDKQAGVSYKQDVIDKKDMFSNIHKEYINKYEITNYINYNIKMENQYKKLFEEIKILKELNEPDIQILETYKNRSNIEKIDESYINSFKNFDDTSYKDTLNSIIPITTKLYQQIEKPFVDDYENFIKEGSQKYKDDKGEYKNDEKECIFCKNKLGEEQKNIIKNYIDWFNKNYTKDKDKLRDLINNELLNPRMSDLDQYFKLLEQHKNNEAYKKIIEDITQCKNDIENIKTINKRIKQEIQKKIDNMGLQIDISQDFNELNNVSNSLKKFLNTLSQNCEAFNKSIEADNSKLTSTLNEYIKYLLFTQKDEILNHNKDKETITKEYKDLESQLKQIEDNIKSLKTKIPSDKDYNIAITKINEFLNKIWSPKKQIQIKLAEDKSSYEVLLYIDNELISNPLFSEGEKNSIVIAYFLIQLEKFIEENNNIQNKICVMDDIVSSFDIDKMNHIYTLIYEIFFKKEGDRYTSVKNKNIKLLFLTHSYDIFGHFFNALGKNLITEVDLYTYEGGEDIQLLNKLSIPINGMQYYLGFLKVYNEYKNKKKKNHIYSKLEGTAEYRNFLDFLSNMFYPEDNDKNKDNSEIKSVFYHTFCKPAHSSDNPYKLDYDDFDKFIEYIKKEHKSIYDALEYYHTQIYEK